MNRKTAVMLVFKHLQFNMGYNIAAKREKVKVGQW
jgi:hypothetical protein